MSQSRAHSLSATVIRVAAAGAGTALGGPLVGALTGLIGHLLSGPAAEVVQNYAEKFGDKAGEKLLELGGDALAEKIGDCPSNLENLYREALQRSLDQVRPRAARFDDWFVNWKACLAAPGPLQLPPIRSDDLLPVNIDRLFRNTMENLDAQGTALRRSSVSLQLACRSLPSGLFAELQRSLPALLEDNFRDVLSEPEYDAGWKQLQWESHQQQQRLLRDIDRKTGDLPMEIMRRLAEYLEARQLLQSLPVAAHPENAHPDDAGRPWKVESFVKDSWAANNPAEPLLRAGQWVVARFQSKPSGTWKDPYARLEGLWDESTHTAHRFAQEPFRAILRNKSEISLRSTALCIPSYKADVEWREETLVRGALWGSIKLAIVRRFLRECRGKEMICLILHIGVRDEQGVCKLYSQDYDRFLEREWPYYKGLEAALSTNDLYKKTWSAPALKNVIEKRLMQKDFVREAMPTRYREQIAHRPIVQADVELVLRGLIENYRFSKTTHTEETSPK